MGSGEEKSRKKKEKKKKTLGADLFPIPTCRQKEKEKEDVVGMMPRPSLLPALDNNRRRL